MKPFQKYNALCGWLIFAIAFFTYWLTLEPTASFWDCGEFIAAAYKLQVPHPPGAPLFLLIGRLFSFLAMGDRTQVAYWINFSSVLTGAFTSLLLFWSITRLSKKLMRIPNDEAITPWQTITLCGAGAAGALAYTFTDSAWFSSVEAEVYSMSSFFTAFVVWAMLRWEAVENPAKANRWLIFIFYVIGLSIGVHLLNLVTIPALALIFYYKKCKPRKWGIVLALSAGLLIIYVINTLIIPGLPSMAARFEVFFVNGLGLPFGSGACFFGVVILVTLIGGTWYTHAYNKLVLNVVCLATTFILIGYASFAMVMIRSSHNTPIDENDPSDILSFTRYLEREQYGTRPLLYGPYFNAQAVGYEEGAAIYARGKTKYEVIDHTVSARYAPGDQTILPRIYSADKNHQQIYRSELNLRSDEKPRFTDNICFLINHQLGWMYVRYFFFNFAGRESDEQDADWLHPGKWFDALPAPLAENRGRNNFYMIPFVLGLAGMYFQLVNDRKNFFVVGLLFVLTGIALVVYLNSPPSEPRERDYIYVGSYYAFCFWIGFAVIAFAEIFTKLMRRQKTAAIIATTLSLCAPALMAKEGWNDHDRSNRYFSVDTAVNDLQTCAPDSILFTGGDNETFPHWYAQDVEGVRTDVRVIVSSYFNTQWYIEQAMQPAYQAAPFPFTLTLYNYRRGGPNNPYLPFYDLKIPSMDLVEYLNLLKRDHKGLRIYESANVIPSRDIVLRVDTAKFRASHIVPASMEKMIVPEMHLRLREDMLEVKDLAFLDILATTDWKRPLYVTNTSLSQFNIDLTPYAVKEGNIYRILPLKNPDPDMDLVNTEAAYSNMITRYRFRGLDDPSIYYSDDYRRAVQNHRNNFNMVASALLNEGQVDRAKKLLLYGLDKMPDRGIRYDITHLQTIDLLLALNEDARATEIASTLGHRANALLDYYLETGRADRDVQLQMVILRELVRTFAAHNDMDQAKQFEDTFARYAPEMQRRFEMQ